MSNNIIKSFSEKYNISENELEKLWKKSEYIVHNSYKITNNHKDYYKLVTSIFERMIPKKKVTRTSKKPHSIGPNSMRESIKPGMKVKFVLKKDQPTGHLTTGIVHKVLTPLKHHPRGIKIMDRNGLVGRVQHIL